MIAAFLAWRAATRHELTEIGTEVALEGTLAPPAGRSPGVSVGGRIDRVERDAQGRIVVVDIKTAKTPVTKDDAQHHAQLGLYQLAVSAGLLPDGIQVPDETPVRELFEAATRLRLGGTRQRTGASSTEKTL